jgi:ketosteroid isomerase-like protein
MAHPLRLNTAWSPERRQVRRPRVDAFRGAGVIPLRDEGTFFASRNSKSADWRLVMMNKYLFAVCGVLVGLPAYGQDASAERELIKVEHALTQAVVDRDVAALNQLYADEFISTDSEGMVWTKSQDIAIDTEGASRVASFTLADLRVQVYGDVAVVTGRIATKGTLAGEASEGRSRFTDVFVKRDGRWQCVANHTTTMGEGF